MQCQEVRNQLSALLDGELADAMRPKVEAHLDACTACARERNALASLRESMQAWETPRLNAFAASRIEERLLAQARQGVRLPVRRWVPAAGLSALVVAALLLLVLRHGRESSVRPLKRPLPIVAKETDETPMMKKPSENHLLVKLPEPTLAKVQCRNHRSHRSHSTGRLLLAREPQRAPEMQKTLDMESVGPDTIRFASAALTETVTTPVVIADASATIERDLLDMMTETQ